MRYTVQQFSFQSDTTDTQAVEGFKKACRKFADDAVTHSEYGSAILPETAVIQAVIANRDVKKYERIVNDLAKQIYKDCRTMDDFANIVLAGLSFMPNNTTVSALMPVLQPFTGAGLWIEEVEQTLRGLRMTGKIAGCDLNMGLDNIFQRND